jgi:hypothetical protein
LTKNKTDFILVFEAFQDRFMAIDYEESVIISSVAKIYLFKNYNLLNLITLLNLTGLLFLLAFYLFLKNKIRQEY